MNDYSEIHTAIAGYAGAYAKLADLQRENSLLPPGRQKTDCIGEFYAHVYLLKARPLAVVTPGGHSNKVWDFRVSDAGHDTLVQVQTVSGYSATRLLPRSLLQVHARDSTRPRPAPRKVIHRGCEFSINLSKESSGERHLSLLRRAERLSPGRRPAARPSPELPWEAVGQGPDRGVRRPPYRGRPHSRQRPVRRVRPRPRGWRPRQRLPGLRGSGCHPSRAPPPAAAARAALRP